LQQSGITMLVRATTLGSNTLIVFPHVAYLLFCFSGWYKEQCKWNALRGEEALWYLWLMHLWNYRLRNGLWLDRVKIILRLEWSVSMDVFNLLSSFSNIIMVSTTFNILFQIDTWTFFLSKLWLSPIENKPTRCILILNILIYVLRSSSLEISRTMMWYRVRTGITR